LNQIVSASELSEPRDAFLSGLGDRVRMLRARRGLTRKALAIEADMSERHLANLESGVGNVSVLLLRQLALALNCSMAGLLGEERTGSAEWKLILRLLASQDEAGLKRVRQNLAQFLGASAPDPGRLARIALIGLRGAGKSTLGRMLADELAVTFVELNRVIEQLAGCSAPEVHAMYGAAAYRRYELRALEHAIETYPKCVIAIPGGLVSESDTFGLLLSRCFTVWVKALPEEHMRRVIAQGDLRPMAGNNEAMADLKRILDGRTPFYAQADFTLDTSGKPLADSFLELRARLRAEMAGQ
jgi:XRE family transcriptional regulator, aerobic/anaerobic benzoate catabolism transcriptional regulator